MVISAVSVYTCFKFKAELDRLKQPTPVDEKKVQQNQSAEFSIGLSSLNSEFSGEITLDALTGLPGREAFEDRLQQTVNQSKRFEKSFAIILMNISDFHLVNEQKGYGTGDKLLQEVAKRMQGIIRQIDTMTRFAGNMFIFLLPQLSLPETAVYVAQRILDNIVLPFNINNENIYINANVGVAIYPLDGTDPRTLLKNANEALLQAKAQGTGKYQFFRQEMHALGQRELDLRSVFTSPDYLQKLSIQYCSQINVKTNEVVSVQAIPFIQFSKYGIVSFSEFLKVASNCKKTVEIGEWLLRNTTMQFNKWHQDGFTPRKLVLGVTIDQVIDTQFNQTLSQKLKEYQIQPNQIVFEIIGDNILAKADLLESILSLSHNQGIQIAFSVLTLGVFALKKLTQLPIDYLKIDSKLVQNEETRRQNEAVIHMLITLSHELQIKIVADGVDTEKQKELLVAMGCDIMQGKLFANPMPIDIVV